MPAFRLLGSSDDAVEGRLDGSNHTLAQLLHALLLSGRTGCLSLRAARGKVTGAINLASGKLLNARLGPFTGEPALAAASAIRRLDYQMDKVLTDKQATLPDEALGNLAAGPSPARLNLASCAVYSIQADGAARGGRSDDEAARFEAEYRYLRHYGDVIGQGIGGKPASAAVVWESSHCLGYRETATGITGIIAPNSHTLSQLLATL